MSRLYSFYRCFHEQIRKWIVSTYSEERIAAGVIVELLLSNGIATCELKTNTNAEPIPWELLSAKAIRDRQKWLTSNCCVDAIDDKQTPSSIQKQMQSIIREEIGDDSNSDVVNLMSTADSFLPQRHSIGICLYA